jgi:hypothetical protein
MKHELVHAPPSRKRTSVLAGCTFTSTPSGGSSRNRAIGRVALVMQHVAIGLADGVVEQLVAHEAAVDEQVLGVARRRD